VLALVVAGAVLVVGAGAAVGAGVSAAATQVEIKLTATGPQPAEVKLNWGDTVVFTNADTVPHSIAIPKLALNSPAIPPGGTLTQVFDGKRGSYPFRQRLPSKSYPGLITVEVTGTLTLKTPKPVVPTGRPVLLSGVSAYGPSPVSLQARLAGASSGWVVLATVTPDESGAFSAPVAIARGGRLRATAAAGQLVSPTVSVTILPKLKLTVFPRKTKKGRPVKITTRIQPANAARTATLETFNPRRNAWSRVRTSSFTSAGVVTFTWPAAGGSTLVRVIVPRSSVNSGFAPTLTLGVTVKGL
jgi:plastocyanin